MSTSPSTNDVKTGRYAIPLFFALIAAGLAGNYFKFEILNLHFIFGSIFAMLALQFFGHGRGILAAAIISSYTYLAWNHPYAIITMTAEVAVVGWLFRRRKINLLMADTLYWLFIGIPIGYICFHFIMHLPVSNTIFLMTKQSMNGIANALIARLIFTGYALRSNSTLISFREIVSNLLAFFVLGSTLIMLIASSKTDFAETDRGIRKSLILDSRRVTSSLENWVENRRLRIAHLAETAATLSPAKMQICLEQIRTSDINFLRIALIDKESTAIAYSPPVDELGRSTIGKSFADRPYIPLLKQALKPMLSEVMVSRFGRPDPVAIMLAPVLSHGSYNGAVGGIMNFDRIQTILKMSSDDGRGMLYTLLDKNGHVIVTNHKDQKTGTPFSRGKGTLSDHQEGISQWIPPLPTNISTIELWGRSRYLAESTIGKLAEWKLILERPVAPFQKMLYDRYIGKLTLLFLILLASLVVAELLSRNVAITNEKLRNLTRDLPAKLASGVTIEWPESGIQDNKYLIANFREMADSLTARFNEIQRINESLEQRVEARTHELQASEEQLSNAMEIAHLGHWEYDIADDLFMFNDHFYNIFRTTAKEMGGYQMSSDEYAQRFVHPDDRHVVGEEIRKAVEATDPHYRRQIEHRMLYADGTVGHISVRIFIVKDNQSRTVRTYGVNQDITHRKRAEKALRESEEKFRRFFEDDLTGDYITTADGIILDCNPAFLRLFGYQSKAEAVGESITELYPEILERGSIIDQLRVTEKLENYEAIMKRKDGILINVNRNIVATFDEDSEIIEIKGYLSDITERKHLESQLQQAQKMEAIGTLAGGIAHDFNNVLSPIIIHSEMVMDDLPPGSPLQQNMKEIYRASIRARDLVRQILAFSRQQEKERVPTNISRILTEAMKLLRSSLPTTIDIQYDINTKENTILADPTQIHQIIMNLCTNAAHTMEEKGGTLELILTNEILDAEYVNGFPDLEPGQYLRLSVRDTGHGIEPGVMDKIFEPYFTTKGVGKGTGMGLALVHGIVKSYGGAVTVHSEVGKGTSFHVYLRPVERETGIFEPENNSTKLPKGTERILLIDDEQPNINAFEAILKRLGYEVTSRTSSMEALEAFRNNPYGFDLVITDQTMPQITGKDLAKQMMAIRPDIPIILCTGFSDQIDEIKTKEIGIRAFVMKPIIMSEIARTIRAVLGG